MLAGDACSDGADDVLGSGAGGDLRKASAHRPEPSCRSAPCEEDLVVAALPEARYGHVVEPACGVGLVTVRLAGRAGAVSASDGCRRAVSEARARCAGLDNVVVRRRDVRDGPPAQPFDLAVLRNVFDDLGAESVVDLVLRWRAACTPGGHLLLVHRRPSRTPDRDDARVIARAVLGHPVVELAAARFRLDVFDAPPA